MVVRGEEYDQGDRLYFNFDNDHDGIKEVGDNQLYIDAGKNSFHDFYFKADGSSSADIAALGSDDGVGVARFYPEAGIWVFEVAYPLNTADDAHDFSLSIGDTVGFNLQYWDDAGNNGAGGWPAFTIVDWTKMASIVIAGPLQAPPPSNADLSIEKIEISQAIQNLDDPNTPDNSLPLVRGKTTLVRVYVGVNGVPGPVDDVVVFLYGLDGETKSILAPPLVQGFDAVAEPDRGQLAHTANFLLPMEWVQRESLILKAFLKVPPGQAETDYSNNWMPEKKFTFSITKILNIYEVPLNVGTPVNPILPGGNFMQQQEEYLEKVFPVAKVNFIRLDWRAVGVVPLPINSAQVIAKLNQVAAGIMLAWFFIYFLTGQPPGFPFPDQVYGFLPPATGFGGISDPVWSGGLGMSAFGDLGSSQEGTMAHEIIHNLGPGDCNNQAAGMWGRHISHLPVCGGPGEAPGIIYGCSPAGICPAGPDPIWQTLYNDHQIHEYGVDTWTTPPLIIPKTTPDIMSYAQSGGTPTKWISSYRWPKLLNKLLIPGAGLPAQVIDGAATDGEETLVISGWVSQDGRGFLDPVYRLPGWSETLASRVEGDYFIELQDAEGRTLFTRSFQAAFIDVEGREQDPYHFTLFLPYQKGVAQVLLKHGERVISKIKRSANPPAVKVLQPTGGETWKGVEVIKWEGSDPDGDPLTYIVQFSPDGGKMWLPLALGITETSLSVDTSWLPGGRSALIRVIATDGFNTAQGESDGFFIVADKVPEARIVQPADGTRFHMGELVLLRARARDVDDMILPDEAYRWYSSREGFLGYGNPITAMLSPGIHQITLTVTDSSGDKSMDGITIEVLAPPKLGMGRFEGHVLLQVRSTHNGVLVCADSYCTATDVNGFFVLDIPPGTYNVTAEMISYLDAIAIDIVAEPDRVVTLPAITLHGGDVNGDGRVDAIDLSQVAQGLGLAGPGAADINGDGMVDVHDLVKVGMHFDEQGPLPWSELEGAGSMAMGGVRSCSSAWGETGGPKDNRNYCSKGE